MAEAPLSIKAMKETIRKAGLSVRDLVEKPDVIARYNEAQAKLAADSTPEKRKAAAPAGGKKKKKPKKKAAPTAPAAAGDGEESVDGEVVTRKMGPFIYFSQQKRAAVKAEVEASIDAEATPQELNRKVMSRLSELWKALSDAEKQVEGRRSHDDSQEEEAEEEGRGPPGRLARPGAGARTCTRDGAARDAGRSSRRHNWRLSRPAAWRGRQGQLL